MGMYGGDLGQYTTPDGRQVTLPSDLAATLTGLTPVQPAAPGPALLPDLPAPAQPPPARAAPAQAIPSPASPAAGPPTDGPVTSPDQLPATTGQPAPRPQGPVMSPAEDTGTSSRAPIQSPAALPQQVSQQQLAKLGESGVYNAQAGAIEEQKQAARRVGEANADQMTAMGNAAAEAADREREVLEQRQRIAQAQAADLEKKTNEYLTNAKAIADTRIDRTLDHPTWTAIGLALSTLGSAMKGQDNQAAIKGVYDALDRKVAAQMQDLEMRQKGLAVQREGLDLQRLHGKDRLEQLDVYRLAAIDQAKRKIDAIKMQTSVPGIRAAADEMQANLDAKKAEVLGGAQERYVQQRNAEANRAQAAQFHRDTMKLQWAQLEDQRQARAAALAEKLIDAKGAAGAAQAKLIGEQAIVDPSTGDFMLTPQGQQKMQQADAAEAQARGAKDPAQAQKLNEYAQQLRESARTNDIAIALNKKGAEEAQKIAGVAQNMANNVDAARRMLQAGPASWDRQQWAQIKVALQGVKVNYAQQMGERMSPKALDAIDEVLSVDPDSIWSREADKSKALAALSTVETQINQSADVAIRSAGVKSGWMPSKRRDDYTFSGSTAQEVAAGAKPGLLTQYVVNPIAHPIDTAQGNRTPDALQDQALEQALGRKSAKGNISNYGLDPDQDDAVRAMIKRAEGAGNKQYNDIAASLAQPLTSDRPGLAQGIAGLLKDEDPQLLDAALAKVAASAGKQKADEVRALVESPKLTPKGIGAGGLTPQAAADLATAQDRMRRGLPAYPSFSSPAPPPPQMQVLRGPPLPAMIQALPPDQRAKWLDWARNNGFGTALQGVE